MSQGPPRIGVLLTAGQELDAGTDLGRMVAAAVRAESLGMHRVAVSDHLAAHVPSFDPVACLAAMAQATSRVRLGSEVLVLARRHPVLVAQAFTTLDVLSGGRIELGVGVGGEWPEEFAAVGIDPRSRGSRVDEALEVIRQLWRDGTATLSGRHFDLRDVRISPQPVQRPHPPVVVGGRSDAALGRAATLAERWDGIFFDPPQFADRVRRLDELAGEAGRTVDAGAVVWVSVGEPVRARRRLEEMLEGLYRMPFGRFERSAVYGDVGSCASRLSELAAAGAADLTVIPVGPMDEQLEAIAEVAANWSVAAA